MSSSSSSESTSIHDGLVTLEVPEGYQVMSDQDLKETGSKGNDDAWAICNLDLHVIINVSQKKISFLSRGVSLDKVIKNTERLFGKMDTTFRKIEDVTHTIGGEEAPGFRYAYTAQGISMSAEYVLTKTSKHYVAFVYLARTPGFQENYATFKNLLATAVLGS